MTKSPYAFPEQLLAVDCIVLGYENESLKILLSHRAFEPAKGEWSLPGGWVGNDETAEQAAERVLYQITGLKNIYLDQVQVFSEVNRDPGGRVVSIAFFAMIRIDKHDRDLADQHGAEWVPVIHIPDLIFDHNEMVKAAHEKLKSKASFELIGQDLLPSKFTMIQLRKLYEAVFQRKFDPGNFRKKALSLRILQKQKDKNTAGSKKGAYYYKFTDKKDSLMRNRIVKVY
jgi:8-oxo-dGTP diphosphatase